MSDLQGPGHLEEGTGKPLLEDRLPTTQKEGDADNHPKNAYRNPLAYRRPFLYEITQGFTLCP